MHKSWNDELISAYLDGELTAEEQAQVELALGSDASLRQMHDDLRALRHSLQSMPRVKLGDDFTAQVLAQAKLAKQAAGPSDAALAPSTREQPSITSSDRQPATTPPISPPPAAATPIGSSEPLAWKAMVWSIAGIAAALLCVLLLPQEFSQFAQRTSEAEVPLAKSDLQKEHDVGESVEALENAPASGTLAKSLANEEAADGGGFGGGLGGGLGSGGLDSARPGDNLRRSGFGDSRPGPTVDSVAPADNAQGKGDAPIAERPLKMQANTAPRASAKADKSLPDNALKPADRKQENKEFATPNATKERQADAATGTPAPLMRVAPAPFSDTKRDIRSAITDETENVQRKNRELSMAQDLARSSDRLQVVVVDMPATGLRKRLMETTLARRGIAVVEQVDEQLAAKKKTADEQTKYGNESDAAATYAQRDPQNLELARAAEQAAKDAPGDVEVFYLEAPAEAVGEMLADLEHSGYAVRFARDRASAVSAQEVRSAQEGKPAQEGKQGPAGAADLLLPRNGLEEKFAEVPASPLATREPAPDAPLADTAGAAPAGFGAAKASGGSASGGAARGGAGGRDLGGNAENAAAPGEGTAVLDSATPVQGPRGRALRLKLPEFRSADGVGEKRTDAEREERAKDQAGDDKRNLLPPSRAEKSEAAQGQPSDQPLAPEAFAPQPNDPKPTAAARGFDNAKGANAPGGVTTSGANTSGVKSRENKEKLDANVMRRAAAPASVRVLIVIQADAATK